MIPLNLDDAGEIEPPERGCIIQLGFVYSNKREFQIIVHKESAAAHMIEKLLYENSDRIEHLLEDLLD